MNIKRNKGEYDDGDDGGLMRLQKVNNKFKMLK